MWQRPGRDSVDSAKAKRADLLSHVAKERSDVTEILERRVDVDMAHTRRDHAYLRIR